MLYQEEPINPVPQEVPAGVEGEREQPDDRHISSMAKAISRAVEVALCNVLENKDILHPAKRSPQQKRVEDQQVVLEKETEPKHHWDFILIRPITCILFIVYYPCRPRFDGSSKMYSKSLRTRTSSPTSRPLQTTSMPLNTKTVQGLTQPIWCSI